MKLLTIDKKSGSISKSQVVSICRTLIQCQKNANIEYLNLKKSLTSSSRRVRVNPTATCTGFLASRQGLASLLYSLKMSFKRRVSPISSAFVKERIMHRTNPIIHVKFVKAISYVVTS